MKGSRISISIGLAVFAAATMALAGCVSAGTGMAKKAMAEEMRPMMAMDPMKSDSVPIDRFSAAAGHLQVRDGMTDIPGANQPVDFDKPPFVTTGLGPHGETVSYYNFDVQPTTPAPIYVLFRKGEMSPVAGQLNIVDVIPGDPGYSDFWQINKVTVPADYVVNSIGSLQAIKDAG